jgi:hypothetical protein
MITTVFISASSTRSAAICNPIAKTMFTALLIPLVKNG